MSTMNQRPMMWRATATFGAFALGLMLAYIGFLLGGDAQRGVAFRIFAASPLLLGASVCLIAAVREMRGPADRPDGRSPKTPGTPASRARGRA